MAGSNSNYSILVDVQLQEESIKKQLKEIQNNKDTKLNIGVTADGAERTKKELDGVTQSTRNLNTETENIAVILIVCAKYSIILLKKYITQYVQIV